jgi:hypothetical protein
VLVWRKDSGSPGVSSGSSSPRSFLVKSDIVPAGWMEIVQLM